MDSLCKWIFIWSIDFCRIFWECWNRNFNADFFLGTDFFVLFGLCWVWFCFALFVCFLKKVLSLLKSQVISLGLTFVFVALRFIALDKMNQIISHSSVPLDKGQCLAIENVGKKIHVAFWAIDLFIVASSAFISFIAHFEGCHQGRKECFISSLSLSYLLLIFQHLTKSFYLWTWDFCIQE